MVNNSSKGRVYQTECEIIQSFDLIAKQNCTKYVAVSFQLKYAQTVGFLSRQNIIRLKINKDDECPNSNEEKDRNISIEIMKKGGLIDIENGYKIFKCVNKIFYSKEIDTC